MIDFPNSPTSGSTLNINNSEYVYDDVKNIWKINTGNVVGITTTNVTEGQNLYYTDTRVYSNTITAINSYTLNPKFATNIGFGNDAEILYYNDGTNQTRSGYWSSKDGFEIRGDGNSKDAVVLQTGHLELTQNGYITGILGVGGNVNVGGTLSATAKSFVIDHPTKPGQKLRYGSLEGPENGVYVRGKLEGNTIKLPEYWTKLIDPDTITVNLTPIGKHQKLFVESIKNNIVTIGSENIFGDINCFYTVFAERADIGKLIVESV